MEKTCPGILAGTTSAIKFVEPYCPSGETSVLRSPAWVCPPQPAALITLSQRPHVVSDILANGVAERRQSPTTLVPACASSRARPNIAGNTLFGAPDKNLRRHPLARSLTFLNQSSRAIEISLHLPHLKVPDQALLARLLGLSAPTPQNLSSKTALFKWHSQFESDQRAPQTFSPS